MRLWFRRLPPRARPERQWIQYGCRWPDGRPMIIYPSQAAMFNDPVFGRNGGAENVGRLMLGSRPITPWRRTYTGDARTHRMQED